MKKCHALTLALSLLLWWTFIGCQAGKEPTISYGQVNWSYQTFTFDLNAAMNSPALEDSLDPTFRQDVGSLSNVISVHFCGSLADGFGLQPQEPVLSWTPDSSNQMVEVQPYVYQITVYWHTGLWFTKYCVPVYESPNPDYQAWTRDPLNPNHSNEPNHNSEWLND